MAAGARTATATSSTTRATSRRPQHRLADGLGASRADGGGRDRPSTPSRAASLICTSTQEPRRALAGGALHRRRFPARRSICATTATRNSFPLWALARYRNLNAATRNVARHVTCHELHGPDVILAVTGLVTRSPHRRGARDAVAVAAAAHAGQPARRAERREPRRSRGRAELRYRRRAQSGAAGRAMCSSARVVAQGGDTLGRRARAGLRAHRAT